MGDGIPMGGSGSFTSSQTPRFFSVEQLSFSRTAKARGINNEPGPVEKAHLTDLILDVLDPVREKLGLGIQVNSGYRCPALNKAVGGVATSQHLKGQAADITSSNNRKLFQLIQENGKFDQVIFYTKKNFVHVSYVKNGRNRRQVLYNNK